MNSRGSCALALLVPALIAGPLATLSCGSNARTVRQTPRLETPAESPETRQAPAAEYGTPALEPAKPAYLSTADLIERPLAELSEEAAAYLEGRTGPAGVAVVVPADGAIYAWNGHAAFHMASVAKVGIMLTLLGQTIQAGREPTQQELDRLRPMITISDNTTASLLWDQIGGGQAVEDYMRSIGLNEIDPNKDTCWGASYASAHDVALLFARLAFGEILDEWSRALAIDLLQGVDPAQTWGVTAAAPDDRPEGTIVGVKDGWYPAECGWWVNSAGMILPANEKPAYTIAVLTGEQTTWQYGIETIETVARLVHDRLHGDN